MMQHIVIIDHDEADGDPLMLVAVPPANAQEWLSKIREAIPGDLPYSATLFEAPTTPGTAIKFFEELA